MKINDPEVEIRLAETHLQQHIQEVKNAQLKLREAQISHAKSQAPSDFEKNLFDLLGFVPNTIKKLGAMNEKLIASKGKLALLVHTRQENFFHVDYIAPPLSIYREDPLDTIPVYSFILGVLTGAGLKFESLEKETFMRDYTIEIPFESFVTQNEKGEEKKVGSLILKSVSRYFPSTASFMLHLLGEEVCNIYALSVSALTVESERTEILIDDEIPPSKWRDRKKELWDILTDPHIKVETQVGGG